MDGDSSRNKNNGYRPPSYVDANWLSRLTLWYISPLQRRAFKHRLEEEDLPGVLPWDQTSTLVTDVSREWEQEKTKREPKLFKAGLRYVRPTVLIVTLMIMTEELIKVARPVLVALLVDYYQGDGVSTAMAWIYGLLLAASGFVTPSLHGMGFHTLWKSSMRCRAAAGALVFRKVMNINPDQLAKISSGRILNYMATDVEKFNMAFCTTPYFIVAPIQVILLTALLFNEFGIAFLAGLLAAVCCAILQFSLARIYGKMRLKIAFWTDKRTHLMNEVIAGMRVIKMYCWEQHFSKIIARLRMSEMKKSLQACVMDAQVINLGTISCKIIAFFTIVTYVLTDHELSPQKVFKLLAWLELLRYILFVVTSLAVMLHSKSYYSSLRVQEFLLLGLEHDAVPAEEDLSDLDCSIGGDIIIDDVHASWTTGKDEVVFTLKAQCDIKQGELIGCVGAVGSGKTSLLLTIMDQMPILSGKVTKAGTLAYAPQESWVFSGTVRENILFGSTMEKTRYENVIKICALVDDIERMPNSDQTLVGERGLSLSGGQKARINLARAVYRDADIYLLDDPLSAVDTKVGKHIFHRCISDYLEKKTRLLVTHQLQHLKDVDKVMIIEDGCITAIGTYDELAEQVTRLLAKTEGTEVTQPSHNLKSKADIDETYEALGDAFVISSDDAPRQDEEERMKGTVAADVYFQYFKAGVGYAMLPLFLILLVMDRSIYIFVDWWLTDWAKWYTVEYPSVYNSTTGGSVPPESMDYMYIYAVLVVCMVIVSCMQALTYYVFTTLAARNLHNKMFGIILHAPIVFFERNPVGQVLNRFARDTGFMDDLLPQQAYSASMTLMTCIATVVFVAVVNPYVLAVSLPLLAAGIWVRQYNLRATRDVKRIEALSRSPVYSHVTASLQGMPVIKAFKMEDFMIQHFDKLQDRHTANWLTFICCSRWLGLRVDWITSTYLTGVICLAMIFSDSLDGTTTGLSLIYIMAMLVYLQDGVRLTADVESFMTSVERILQYTKLEQEAPAHRDDLTLPPDWPTSGSVTFDHVSLLYFDGGIPALTDMCISVKNGEKVGIVGRSGAGKTSLLTALMRITEPTGSILIDGIDVTTIGLEDLRKNISVIPQDPVLFSGTLRANLDPFSSFTDEQLWKAIDEVELKEKVDSLPGQLYSEITEAGHNFSVGQKQLVCLGRALLRKNKILMIDEATANVDQRTDSVIQQTVRSKFVDCTVLTIAHRLNTIMDSDRVIVMHHGELVQFDQPYLLLKDKKGLFYEMVMQTGEVQACKLAVIAERKYNERLAVYKADNVDVNVDQMDQLTANHEGDGVPSEQSNGGVPDSATDQKVTEDNTFENHAYNI